jgi:hypothetical protein
MSRFVTSIRLAPIQKLFRPPRWGISLRWKYLWDSVEGFVGFRVYYGEREVTVCRDRRWRSGQEHGAGRSDGGGKGFVSWAGICFLGVIGLMGCDAFR